MMKLVAFCFLLLSVAAAGTLKNEKVTRNIDLTTSVARVTVTIDLVGGPASDFDFVIPAANVSQLAGISASAEGGAELTVTKAGQDKNGQIYKVALKPALTAQGTATVKVTYSLTGTMKPYPASISVQREQQLVVFYDNLHFLSPYATEEETTTVKLGSPSVESNTKDDHTKVSGDTITYGPYKSVEAFSQKELRVHFQNPAPFLVAESVERTIQLSHWGMVNIEEHVHLKHAGPTFNGVFSRLDYQRYQGGAPTAVTGVTASVPEESVEIYFRDVIGNISSSDIASGDDTLEVTMRQRFPLFGGWQTHFYYGYYLPMSSVVSYENGNYVLNVPVASALKNVPVKELTNIIVLPETASEVKATVDGKSAEVTTTYKPTYLDTTGRPNLQLKATNIVSPDNKQRIQVTYQLSSTAWLREPIMLMCGFMAIFVGAGVVLHIAS